jgi:hypothetical protein
MAPTEQELIEAKMRQASQEKAKKLKEKKEKQEQAKIDSGSQIAAVTATKTNTEIQLPKLNTNGLGLLSTFVLAGTDVTTIDVRILLYIALNQDNEELLGIGISDLKTKVVKYMAEHTEIRDNWADYMLALGAIANDLGNWGLDVEVDSGKNS